LFDVPGISIPYNAPHIVTVIDDKKTAKVPIPKLEAIEINSAYIKITNNSDFSFSLRQSNTELLTLGGRNAIVITGQNAVYEVTPASVSSYTFMRNTTTPVEFPATVSEFKKGIIYSFTYTNTGLVLTGRTSVLQSIPPAMPLNVQAQAISNSSVSVTWNEVYGATSYRIYRTTDSTTSPIGSTASLSYADTTVSAGQTYYYSVSAVSGTNNESVRSPLVSVNMFPSDFRSTSSTTISITLAWNVFNGASGYNIYRSDNENGTYTQINTALVTDTNITDTNVLPDTAYYYKISAVIGENETLQSESISTSTLSPVPANIRRTSRTTISNNLAWDVVSGASGYNVYRSDTENGTYNKLNTEFITGTTFIDTDLLPGTTYYYKISSINGGVEGLPSDAIIAATLSAIPVNIRIINTTTISINFVWDALSGASGYNVYRSDTENGTYLKLNTEFIIGTTFTDTGLSPGTTYYYKVSSINNGLEGLPSGAIIAATLSAIPANIRITNITTSSVSLAWNTISEASGYNVYRSDNENGTYSILNTAVLNNNEYTDTGLLAYTTYYYKISSIVSEVESELSNFFAGSTGVIVSGNDLAAKLAWIKNNALSNSVYAIELSGNENLSPQDLSYSGKSNIIITIRGITMSNINLSSNGSLFTIGTGVTLIVDNNVTLNGRTNNNTSLVRINNGGILVMNEGSKITGNTAMSTTNSPNYVYGGGVYVDGGTFLLNGGKITGNNVSSSYSTGSRGASGGGVYISTGIFTMNAGEISGNNIYASYTSSYTYNVYAYGAGVYISNGIFNMNGGEILSNTATANGYSTGNIFVSGGGVYVTSGSVKFRMSGGVIYGSNATGGLANSATSGRALYCEAAGTAQYGTVNDNTFYRSGDFGATVNTNIRVTNGNLLTN
jgi:fibronectin type 3 domain-containing protein